MVDNKELDDIKNLYNEIKVGETRIVKSYKRKIEDIEAEMTTEIDKYKKSSLASVDIFVIDMAPLKLRYYYTTFERAKRQLDEFAAAIRKASNRRTICKLMMPPFEVQKISLSEKRGDFLEENRSVNSISKNTNWFIDHLDTLISTDAVSIYCGGGYYDIKPLK